MEDNFDNSSIALVSLDKKRTFIDTISAKNSKFMDDFRKDFPNEEIQLNNIKFSTCEKIKTYLEHYKDKKPKRIPRPLPNKDFKEVVGEWDYEYINIDVENIYELMQASNFLGIESLLDLTTAKIASLIKGKNPEEIRRILGMDDQDIDELEENEIIDEDDDE